MATPHLCSKKEKTASSQHVLGTGSHLLIIQKKGSWSNKELIVTPDEELYSMAATYATCNTYSYRYSGAYADGVTMSNRLKNIRNGMSITDWQNGHKPLYTYCARSNGLWRIKSDKDVTEQKLISTLEYGANWTALKFNLYAMPLGNFKTVKAYLRVWNPSSILTVDPWGFEPVLHNRQKRCDAYTYVYNRGGHLLYHFDNTLMSPVQCEASMYGDLDVPSIANEGYGGGTVVTGIEYDIYGAHLQVASKTSCYVLNYTHIYKKQGSTDAYFRDVEITGDALTQLKSCIATGQPVWMHNGFVMADMSSEAGHG